MTVRPFRPEDLAAFQPGPYDRGVIARSRFADAAAAWAGHAATLWLDGQAIAIGGVSVDGDEGLGWLLLSDEVRRRPFTLHRLVKRTASRLLKETVVKRLYADVPHGFAAGHRWVRRLGFARADETEHCVRYVRTA